MRGKISAALIPALLVAGCAVAPQTTAASCHSETAQPLQIAVSTQVLKDIVQNIAKDAAKVTAAVPKAADPQFYDPLISDIKNIANADIAFYNYAQYEDPRLIAVFHNYPEKTVELATKSLEYAANIIPLIKDQSLDTVWLGLRDTGVGFTKTSQTGQAHLEFRVTGVAGPGQLTAYQVTSFGQPRVVWNSADGFEAASGYAADSIQLPIAAHTHLSWAFSEAGVYKVQIAAVVRADIADRASAVDSAEIVFIVGNDVQKFPEYKNRRVLDSGHLDITADIASSSLYLSGETVHTEKHHGAAVPHTHTSRWELEDVIISVPGRALQPIPQRNYEFLGTAGQQIYLLPQAVLGRNLNGEIDPHLLADPHNAKSYVATIRDRLSSFCPAKAAEFHKNAAAYIAQIENLEKQLQKLHNAAASDKNLITASAKHRYFAAAFGYEIAAVLREHPAAAQTPANHKKLLQIMQDTGVQAVFIDSVKNPDSTALTALAAAQKIPSCKLYDQELDQQITSYLELLAYNSKTVVTCGKKNDEKVS